MSIEQFDLSRYDDQIHGIRAETMPIVDAAVERVKARLQDKGNEQAQETIEQYSERVRERLSSLENSVVNLGIGETEYLAHLELVAAKEADEENREITRLTWDAMRFELYLSVADELLRRRPNLRKELVSHLTKNESPIGDGTARTYIANYLERKWWRDKAPDE